MTRVIAAAVGLAMLLTGCATTVDGKPSGQGFPSPSSTPAPIPASTSSSAGSTTWSRTVDAGTGISFEVPGHPSPQSSPGTAGDGTPLVRRLYTVQLNGDNFGVSVTIETSSGTPLNFANLDAIPGELSEQFKQAGTTDLKILGLKHLEYDRHKALDFQISFTPLDHQSGKSLWYLRAIDAGGTLVLLQTIDFPPVGDTSQGPLARSTQSHLVGSVVLP